MLLFAVVDEDRLPDVRRAGLHGDEHAPVVLWRMLEAAHADRSAGVVLVVDGDAVLPDVLPGRKEGAERVEAAAVPPQAIRNLDPYLRIRPVTAAGGCVMRDGPSEPELLLIYRNGCWDLPKGKLDDGETPEAGALREVREEVGIERLRLVGPLGTTLHGYARAGAYWVKTTYWYRMRTEETTFTPQADEGIERVEWVAWSEACERIGYGSLRRHMESLHVLNGGRQGS